jgi:hypothetical protein
MLVYSPLDTSKAANVSLLTLMLTVMTHAGIFFCPPLYYDLD